MKKYYFILSAALLLNSFNNAIATTPETINEYYSSNVEGSLVSSKFKVQAVRSENQNGVNWRIRLVIGTNSISRAAFFAVFLTFEEGNKLLSICKSFLEMQALAKASSADIFEKRIGINDELDVVYRFNKNESGEEFWLSSPGNLNPNDALTVDRGNFNDMIKALQTALDKASSVK